MKSKFTKQVILGQIENLHSDALVYLYESTYITVNNLLVSGNIHKEDVPALLREFVISTWFALLAHDTHDSEADAELMIVSNAKAYLKDRAILESDIPIEKGEAIRPYINLMSDADRELLHLSFAEKMSVGSICKHLNIAESKYNLKLVEAISKLQHAFEALQGKNENALNSEDIIHTISFLRTTFSYDEYQIFIDKADRESINNIDFLFEVYCASIKERKQVLDLYIKNKARIKFIGNAWGSTFTYISGVIVVIAILGYFLTNDPEVKDKPVSLVDRIADRISNSGGVFKKNRDEFDLSSNAELYRDPVEEEAVPDNSNKTSEVDTEKVADIVIELDTDSLSEADLDDLVIKKDVLLKVITVKVIEKKRKQEGQELDLDLSLNTAEKLNPDAKLPEKEKAITHFVIDLWKSPVKYKGYRGFRNRVIIYGMEEAEWMRVYKLEENFYLGYEPGAFYKLELNNEFKPFVKLKDVELIQILSL